MNIPFFIARRYFFSKKKKNFINVISIISMFGVAVGTAALIIVLSVFNGLEGLMRSLQGYFDPEIKIEAVIGKSFILTDSLKNKIQEVEGVHIITEVIEDNVYVRYQSSDLLVTLKGVSDNFIDQHRMDKAIVDGEMLLKKDGVNYAVIGAGVQYELGLSLENDFFALQLYSPKNVKPGVIDPSKLYNRKNIKPAGVFQIEKQYDERYIFVPLAFAQELMDYTDKRTSLEIKVKQGADILEVQKALKQTLGTAYKIRNTDEQHASIFRAVKIEKLFVFIALSAVLAIIAFNIFFTLSMLAIDKKKDIAVLYAMGATNTLIRAVFITEGVIIAFTGAAIGVFLGFTICWLQETYGFVSMGMASSVIDAYPVKMEFMDFVYTSVSVTIITFINSYRPAVLATRSNIVSNL